MNALEVSNLAKSFTKKLTRKVHALDDVSFIVPEGRVFGFIGPNGAGKSTTIKILMGLLRPDAGKAFFYDRNSADPVSRQRVGFLAENPSYYDYLTPRELLSFVGTNFGVASSLLPGKVAETLRLVELDGAAERPIRTLSKGMVQRLGLGQALVHDPDLYVLDEPMSGLDPLGRSLVSDIIRSLKRRGKTVFFSTHIIHDVERICDDVAVLLNGSLKFHGAIKSIIDESFTRYEVIVRTTPGIIPTDFPPDVVASSEGDHSKLFVPKQTIANSMQRLLELGEIVSIEPERRTLEQIFIELVKIGKGTNEDGL